MAGSKDLTDEDLLGGDDDGNEVIDDSGVVHDFSPPEDTKDESEILGGDGKNANPDDKDELDVVILDDDEGEDAGKAAADADADAQAGDLSADDDGGEEVQDDKLGQDFLTDWEKKNYSKAMQGRVSRERRLKETERERADQAEATAAQAVKESFQARKMVAELLSVNLENSIKAKTAELKAAKESADTDAEIKAQGELDELRAKKRDVDASKDHLEKIEKEGGPAAKPVKPQINPLTQRWLTRNKWMGDKRFAEEAALTRMIDQGLGNEVKAGQFQYGPDTPQYFAEMDRRIKAKMPSLAARAQKAFGQQQESRQTVAPVNRGAPSRPAGSKPGRVELTRDDLSNMRNFGLDPKNPTHLKEYARNKMQSQGANHG